MPSPNPSSSSKARGPAASRLKKSAGDAAPDSPTAASLVDLTGGYYDAGDNVKFNLPMAYTTLSWSAIEYGKKLGPQVGEARAAIRCDFGDPNADHKCWERPEDDELLWGAGWLFTATNQMYYLNFLKSVGGNDGTDTFSWDNKYAGARVLLARVGQIN
ncbi:hypothetical protein SASPL_150358 [Salvia splendens]|uniref:cellulase n=1 Tax=Salvia splendens TaxID=180675 RepID=A0A8X8Z2S1_SALSN|nr:hypothetical protein SASPL_150358 [Salvia splendens]